MEKLDTTLEERLATLMASFKAEQGETGALVLQLAEQAEKQQALLDVLNKQEASGIDGVQPGRLTRAARALLGR